VAITPIATGLTWPFNWLANVLVTPSVATLDASGEKMAMIGRMYWDGRATSKTIDTTGSSKIEWRGGSTAVFDNAGSSLEVGIQGVNTSGPIAQPNGSFGAKAVITTAADASPTLTTINAWHTITPTTGTSTIAHGDLIAVVWDFVTRAGSDAIIVSPANSNTNLTQLPTTNAFAAAAWGATGSGQIPNCLLRASDGTYGWIDGGQFFGWFTNTTWNDGTNPDEQGVIFQVPFDCKVDALFCSMRTASNASDFTISLSSNAESARTTLASVTVDGAQLAATGTERSAIFNLASEVTLSANVDYCVSVKATNTGDIRFVVANLGNAEARRAFPGSTTIRGVTANNSGNFSGSSSVNFPMAGVRISGIETGSGGGVPLIGPGGLVY
jgi:hypothetical protein